MRNALPALKTGKPRINRAMRSANTGKKSFNSTCRPSFVESTRYFRSSPVQFRTTVMGAVSSSPIDDDRIRLPSGVTT